MATSTATAPVVAPGSNAGPRRPPTLNPAVPSKKLSGTANSPSRPSFPRRLTKSLLLGLNLIKTNPSSGSGAGLSDSQRRLPISPKEDPRSPTTSEQSPIGNVVDIPLFYSNPFANDDLEAEPLHSPKSLEELGPAFSCPPPHATPNSHAHGRANASMTASATAAAAAAVAAVAAIQSAYGPGDIKSAHQPLLSGLPEVPSPMEHDSPSSDEEDDMDLPMSSSLQHVSAIGGSNHLRQRSFSLDAGFPTSASAASSVRPILKKPDSRRLSTGSLRFSTQVLVGVTHNPHDYERKGELTWRLTPEMAMAIKRELNDFKQEMEIHEESRRFTHFFTS